MRRESEPIDGTESLCRFVSTRAAFIAQKTLYGYLKTRMGTRYPSMFEDDVFVGSINIAKMQVYAACLSDLAIYAVSRALSGAPLDDSRRRDLALHCFRMGLTDNAEQVASTEAFRPEEAVAAFEKRLAFWDWQDGPSGPDIFSESPEALIRWAPIAPQLKKYDKEIVQNSIKYAWRDIRVQFDSRLDAAAVAAEVRGESMH